MSGNGNGGLPAREQALELLKKYNKEEFHLRHSLTVEGVMREIDRKGRIKSRK